ncbi:MAG: hypothetical protein A2W05_11690 [Candidatus Schekmanbacteria bacterium RBG_16_38_10]|uniref:Response regulatory domain-containing protein n=1 Tax=Candidatus Schekmanbacteria bacterium RBG_16_38_10 TaxID=1817879 RepID=A0A1F7RWI7_9BACT|nr:MAG: hypothetical protein A2W05_11690 [Candidatus Schekmanbacteria bacterium RBG_16_38_10]
MGQKILLVEDEPDTLKMFKEILESEGYEVAPATNGEEALAIINGYIPDLIVLDIMLPGISGIEVAKKLAERNEVKNIPIVVVTALDNIPLGSDNISGLTGIRRFIFKPCRPKTLLEGIKDALTYKH